MIEMAEEEFWTLDPALIYSRSSGRRFASLQLLLEDWHGLCALFERRKVLGTGAL